MTIDATPHVPALVDSNGEVVPLALGPVSADRAGELLPQIIELSRLVARYRGFLEGVLTETMTLQGQTERRVGSTIYELKSEGVWTVTDEGLLWAVLEHAVDAGDLTRGEVGAAMTERIVRSFNHAKLNVLAKRVPGIDTYRQRSETPAKLRVK